MFYFPLVLSSALNHSISCSVRAESLFERPPEVDINLQSAEFLGPLQYRTWRKMSSIIQPGMQTHVCTRHLSREFVQDGQDRCSRGWRRPSKLISAVSLVESCVWEDQFGKKYLRKSKWTYHRCREGYFKNVFWYSYWLLVKKRNQSVTIFKCH